MVSAPSRDGVTYRSVARQGLPAPRRLGALISAGVPVGRSAHSTVFSDSGDNILSHAPWHATPNKLNPYWASMNALPDARTQTSVTKPETHSRFP